MNNNEYLQQLDKLMPGAWLRQILSLLNDRWSGISDYDNRWSPNRKYRLIPAFPIGCKPPPESAYAYEPDRPGAVCLQGPVKLPEGVKRFSGWAFWGSEWASRRRLFGKDNTLYLLDLNDPNASAILALNKPEWTLPSAGPELPDGWEYMGMGDAMEKGEECLWWSDSYIVWQGPNLCSQSEKHHYARRKQPEREACDRLTEHSQKVGEYDPAPTLVIPADALTALDELGTAGELRNAGYAIRWDKNGIVGWRDE